MGRSPIAVEVGDGIQTRRRSLVTSQTARSDHGRDDVLDRQKQMKGIRRRGHEVESLVEPPSVLVLRVDEYGANADALCGCNRAGQRVLEQRLPQADTRVRRVHRKPSQERARDGVPGQAPSLPSRNLPSRHGACRQGVVARYGQVVVCDEDPRGPSYLRFQRVLLEPLIQRWLAGIERREQVIGPQGLRPDEQAPPLSRGCWAL